MKNNEFRLVLMSVTNKKSCADDFANSIQCNNAVNGFKSSTNVVELLPGIYTLESYITCTAEYIGELVKELRKIGFCVCIQCSNL